MQSTQRHSRYHHFTTILCPQYSIEYNIPTMEGGASAAASRVPIKLPGNVLELLEASAHLNLPLELRLLMTLVALLLFLLLLIMVLWDRYGKEIGELYTSPVGTKAQEQNASDTKVHDVADEFTMYQKLPTFFYEYVPRQKKSS
ncbi:unnamed protein product [Hyaloperonospora brassicae]|uniref:RxLR effector candidate protein n=1 Tax=Hyaloperonospora brassicae TaxID=162125 RepID=A0AAV0UQN3_HYABA|nr:unnamed protein product [Hyaloperonospora brassicae]